MNHCNVIAHQTKKIGDYIYPTKIYHPLRDTNAAGNGSRSRNVEHYPGYTRGCIRHPIYPY